MGSPFKLFRKSFVVTQRNKKFFIIATEIRKFNNACVAKYLENEKIPVADFSEAINAIEIEFKKNKEFARVPQTFIDNFKKNLIASIKRCKINPEKYKVKFKSYRSVNFKIIATDFTVQKKIIDENRIKIDFIINNSKGKIELPFFNKIFADYEFKRIIIDTDLDGIHRKTVFHLYYKLTAQQIKKYRDKKEKKNEKLKCTAVDVGVTKLATFAEGKFFYTGWVVQNRVRVIDCLKSKLEEYKKLGNKHQIERYEKKIQHSWFLVEIYKKNAISGIIKYIFNNEFNVIFIENDMENTYAEMRKDATRFGRILCSLMLRTWQSIKKIDNAVNNLRIIEVSKANTSIMCYKCKNIDKSQRCGENFKCNKCGLEVDADLNAARNIYYRGIKQIKEKGIK